MERNETERTKMKETEQNGTIEMEQHGKKRNNLQISVYSQVYFAVKDSALQEYLSKNEACTLLNYIT